MLGEPEAGDLHCLPVRRVVAAPGPKISRYERPRAVRRSRSGTRLLLVPRGPRRDGPH